MKINLEKADIRQLGEDSLRSLGNHDEVTITLGRMLASSQSIDHEVHGQHLRRLVRAGAQSNFECLHPEWFNDTQEEQETLIDATVCHFCWKNKQCTSTRSGTDVNIMFHTKGRAFTKSEKNAVKLAFGVKFEGSSKIVNDPFIGFSKKSGMARSLKLWRLEDFLQAYPDRVGHAEQQASIAYDLQTHQPIWGVDLALIQFAESLPSIEELFLSSLLLNHTSSLSSYSRRFFTQYCQDRGLQSAVERIGLERLEGALAALVEGLRVIEEFRRLSDTPWRAGVDHSFPFVDFHGLFLLLRMLEVAPFLSETLRNLEQPSALLEFLRTPSVNRLHGGDDGGKQRPPSLRFSPRWPGVLLLPIGSNGGAKLDLPACRVIDVFLAHVDAPLLLIDPLDFDG